MAGGTGQQRCERQFSARERFFCYAQWIADEQWRELRKIAGKNGVLVVVALYGRHSLGVSYYARSFHERPSSISIGQGGGRAANRI